MLSTGVPAIDKNRSAPFIGSDEVGYGAWAGPLVVVAVATPWDYSDPLVKDSKQVKSASKREKIFAGYQGRDDIVRAIVEVSPEAIDESGVYNQLVRAHHEAVKRVLDRLPVKPHPIIVIDGTLPTDHHLAYSLPKADNLVPAVSLASILAKVHRDRLMVAFDAIYPGYGFGKHKGYGTQAHAAALEKLGPCPIHRKSYTPCARAALTPRDTERADFFWDFLQNKPDD